jgi:thiamine kinase-like enzyme
MNYERCYRPKVVCHNDLVAENILDDGTLRFIDLEYAVAADPILDLASLVAMNDFEGDQVSYLLYNYYGGESPCSTQSFFNIVRMTRLLSYFWCLSRMQEAEDSSPFKFFAAEIAAMLR